MHVFVLFLHFLFFFLSFFPLVTEIDEKLVLTQKQMILTSEWHAEHPFAGQNAQNTGVTGLWDIDHFTQSLKMDHNCSCLIRNILNMIPLRRSNTLQTGPLKTGQPTCFELPR